MEISVTANAPAIVQLDPEDGVDRLLIEVPNLDDFSVDPETYIRLREEFTRLSKTFADLSKYADGRAVAICDRKAGDIEHAEKVEREIEFCYRRLPSWAKW